jgi:hypothetical protein
MLLNVHCYNRCQGYADHLLLADLTVAMVMLLKEAYYATKQHISHYLDIRSNLRDCSTDIVLYSLIKQEK